MIIDENHLFMLLNERFDDLNHRIDDLKLDMVKRHEQHETDDKVRFDHLHQEIEPLKKQRWANVGVAGSGAALVTILAEVLKGIFK